MAKKKWHGLKVRGAHGLDLLTQHIADTTFVHERRISRCPMCGSTAMRFKEETVDIMRGRGMIEKFGVGIMLVCDVCKHTVRGGSANPPPSKEG